jgi:quinol monooxygenase YgiN
MEGIKNGRVEGSCTGTGRKRQEFMQACDLITQKERRKQACVSQTLFEKVGESNRFQWVERWTDSGALEEYLGSPIFRALLGVIDVLGELEKKHVIEFKEFPDK